jgi:hypothetical protein
MRAIYAAWRRLENGAIVFPPVPAFYAPSYRGELVDHTVGRVLDLFGFDAGLVNDGPGSRTASDPRLRARRQDRTAKQGVSSD